MELVKKNIHMSRDKGEFETQITLDEDFHLPENQPEMERILMEHHDIVLNNIKGAEERAELSGTLLLEILYLASDRVTMNRISTAVSFTETVNCAGMSGNDMITGTVEAEDVSLRMINSGKIQINAVLTLKVQVKEAFDAMVALCPEKRDSHVSTLQKQLDVLQLRIARKDTFRLKEEVELGNNKPGIGKILWENMELRSMEIKPAQDRLILRGELLLFLMYEGEEPHIPLQWVEQSIHFSGEVLVNGCTPDMIPDVSICLANREMEIKPDYEGEMRVLSLDAVLQLQIRLYGEESISLLNDIYSPSVQMVSEFMEAHFEHLLVKNNAKCKVNEKVKLKPDSKILQICHSGGEWKLDRTQWTEEGVLIEGAILVSLLYMTTDDKEPLQMQRIAVPFSYTLEVMQKAQEEPLFHIRPHLEQLSTVLLGTDEVEVRAGMSFDAMIVQRITEQVIVAVREEPIDWKVVEALPGIVGYIVGEHDTLWSIAKQFYTSVDSLKIANGLTQEQVSAGDRILVIKEAEGEILDPKAFPKGTLA